MIKSYIVIAWRNIIRNKTFSIINIMGLALGMACSLLIALWVFDERGVDGFHTNHQYLYQVYERQHYDGKVEADYHTQGLLAEELKRVVPEIEYTSGLEYIAPPGTANNFEAGGRTNKMIGSFAGNDFFSMFSYPLLQGSAQRALSAPAAIAVSHKMADYFFGSPEKAMGKMIRFDSKENLIITAVFEDMPANSSFKVDFLKSWESFKKQNDWVNNWGNASPATYVQLRANADPKQVERKIRDFIYRYIAKQKQNYTELALQQYSQTYLYSSFSNGKPDGGRIEYVRLFTWIAVFILFIACINFMNLATARSINRAKEVGLRKVIGAVRWSLITQFLGEAIMLTFFSVFIAVALVALTLPVFNDITGKQLLLPLNSSRFWITLLTLLFVTGFLSGSYPALFLSSLQPARVLKGMLKFSAKTISVRQGLVVFQFALSIILIVGMIVIYRQMHYIQTKNLGYDRENLVYVPIEGNIARQYDLFKAEALKIPGVVSISKMRNSPTFIEHHTGGISWPGKDGGLQVSFADAVTGYDFTKTMKLQMREGRDFSVDFATDSLAFIVNETAARKMGYQHPVGMPVSWGSRSGTIVGVVKDFHFNSLHSAIEPLIMRLDDSWNWGTVLIRTRAGKTKETVDGLEKTYKKMNPEFPFTYQFSDQEFDKLYHSELVVSKLTNCFAVIAIFISCLGLFGLAAFTTAQRTKEIGIRKVLGASVPLVVAMLSKQFLSPVIISIFISLPVAWFVMTAWLSNFAYRVEIGWWTFPAAGTAAIGIALITVGFQSVRAAMANPSRSLKSE